MGPVTVSPDNTVQENLLTDEEYVIYRAKISQKNDPSSSKAWAITAKTLFPRNFSVQLEAYTSQKAANNPKEAARHFSSLFFDFPNEPGLWQEVAGITEALQSGSASISSQFHRDLFSHLPLDVQHQLLLAMAERADDTSEHCRLMLVLLSRFPAAIDLHGKKLVDTLLTAEKHSHYQSPVNCFRKLLVVDLLPILLSSKTVDIAQKQLYRLILKSIEFYLNWLACGTSAIQGLIESDIKPGESWKNLFKLMMSMGWKLGWELSTVFSIEGNREMMCQSLWAFYRSTPLGNEDSPNFRQLLYCSTVLLIESLFEYISRLEPNTFQSSGQGTKPWEYPALSLVRAFYPNVDTSVDPAFQRRKEEANCPPSIPLTVTRSCTGSLASGIISSFLTAVSCWELLHQTEDLRNEFGKLCQHLRTDTWTWLPTFLTDAALYQSRLPEALAKLQTTNTLASPIHKQCVLLKSAGIFYSLGNFRTAVEQILHVVANLPEGSSDPPPYPMIPSVSASSLAKHHLHFLGYTRAEIVQYCVNVLIACLKDRALRSGNEDLAMGHLIVLLQYDWPNHAGLLEEMLAKIRRQGHFSYQPFVSYVIHVDVLEEFMFLANEQGNNGEVMLDIFPPSAAQLATQRRMTTRWGDKGAREDFRSAMKRQTARNNENISDLVIRFMLQERDQIIQASQ